MFSKHSNIKTCFFLLFSYVYVVILLRCYWVFIREKTMACRKKKRAVNVQKNNFLDISAFSNAFINCNSFLNCNIRSLDIINIWILSLSQSIKSFIKRSPKCELYIYFYTSSIFAYSKLRFSCILVRFD